ncbi:MAG: 3-oxoacyl-ACP reductase [Gardnerella vaginalis]|nr:MAG: 3-oxoacyl-ACP reductase [Gardnerella vaginalis]PZP07044.1 MAG: 3-oxoacyl-ACP reductase [Gardnerella vaginalis]
MNDFQLDGKVALITGAVYGIGFEIAKSLAEAGATIVFNNLSPESVEQGLENYRAAGIEARGYVCDVTDEEQVQAMVAQIKEEVGSIDILVNNAGITRDNLLMRMKDDEWDDILNTNLTSVFRLSKAVMRAMMKKRVGRIITIGSVVGTMGNAGQANYAAAKAGLIGFSKSLAREVASRGITVNVVAPGFIETDMTRALNEDQRSGILAEVPAGRLGDPQEIANAVAFLASDEAAYITGETLHVNGGMYMV